MIIRERENYNSTSSSSSQSKLSFGSEESFKLQLHRVGRLIHSFLIALTLKHKKLLGKGRRSTSSLFFFSHWSWLLIFKQESVRSSVTKWLVICSIFGHLPATINICPIINKICQKRFKMLPNTILAVNKWPKIFNFSPNLVKLVWRLEPRTSAVDRRTTTSSLPTCILSQTPESSFVYFCSLPNNILRKSL